MEEALGAARTVFLCLRAADRRAVTDGPLGCPVPSNNEPVQKTGTEKQGEARLTSEQLVTLLPL